MNHLHWQSGTFYTDVPVLTMMSSKTFQATILIISFIAKISKNKKGTINTFDILV